MAQEPTNSTPAADYGAFLRRKACLAPEWGFDVHPDEVNPILKPHQRDCVMWALKGGRRALFEAFGLGKTMQQLEILRLIREREAGRCLIVCPLGVRQEFMRDGGKLGIELKFVRWTHDLEGDGLYITNYESIRDYRLDPDRFGAVSLDEASVLRSYGSLTYQRFLELFGAVKYRFVATATPAPNRYKELIHYAGYLGIMDTGQALTRFFQRDSQKANNLTLYPHKEKEFWLWLSSWAVFLQKPSDLGYSDEGYELSTLKIHHHFVKNPQLTMGFERDGAGVLFRDPTLSVRDAAREKRETLADRIEEMKDILADDSDNWIIWHNLEAERHAIKKALPEATEVYGSLDLEVREQHVMDFSDGKIRILATKPILSGSGCNFQRHCHKAIFLGVDWKFNDFIQSVHRIRRFLQTEPCEIHVICSAAEKPILKALQEKWSRHDAMVENMSALIRERGLANPDLDKLLVRTVGVLRRESKGERYTAVNNDCIEECGRLKSASIDLIHTSIPFSNHYEYTPSYNDFGHTDDDEHFFEQMDFLTPSLFQVLKPGRVAAIHVKDRILFGNVTGTGMPTVNPFHSKCIFHYQSHGFAYMGMITVVTDVVRENNQTYRLGWSEQCKDGTKMGVGSPEYILLFRKLPTDRSRGYADEPVVKSKEEYSRSRWQIDAHAFWRSNGNRTLRPEELAALGPEDLTSIYARYSLDTVYDHEEHVKLGEELDRRGQLPASFMTLAPSSHDPDVWHDVNRMRTLNGEQSRRRLAAHVCPLQYDIVDRIIRRYTNEGELVLDPFGGLGTVAMRAVMLGRRGYSVELNEEYHRYGVGYLEAAEKEVSMPSLFDVVA